MPAITTKATSAFVNQPTADGRGSPPWIGSFGSFGGVGKPSESVEGTATFKSGVGGIGWIGGRSEAS